MAALLTAIFSAGACTKKREIIARTETMSQDSLAASAISEDTLDEFEYEADSLETEENEN